MNRAFAVVSAFAVAVSVMVGLDVVSNRTVAPAQAAQPPVAIDIAPAAAKPGSYLVSATFPSGQVGRVVDVQRKSGSRWAVVSTKKLPRDGWVTFLVPGRTTSTWNTYRIVGRAYKGRGSVASPAVSGSRWQQVFSDEFSGKSLNSAKWAVRYPNVYSGLRKCSATNPRLPTVANGTVRLQVGLASVRKPECPRGVFSNTMISTAKSFAGTYGTYAARIKFSPDRGQHGAFWLQADANGSEIDVVEYFGSGRRDSGLSTYVHRGNEPKAGGIRKLTGILMPGQTPANSYHVYSVDWTPKGYVFRIDGKVVFRSSRLVSKSPEYLILSQLTSDWENPLLDKRKLPTTTFVDWVRVWQAK